MAISGKTVLAVVPARGGSKGIPRKNLCKVNGKTLIAHAAAVIEPLDWVDHAILSTDDQEIADEGRRCGLEVPFIRPAEHSHDAADAIGMWQHAWIASEEHFRMRFDISVLVQPTTPTRSPQDIDRAVRTLVENHADSVATVSLVPGHFTPEKILRVGDNGFLQPYLPDGLKYSSRQMIPSYYYRNGIAYAVTREHLVDNGKLMEGECLPVVIEGDIANIDDPIDLAWADFLLSRLSSPDSPSH
ncbi:acylneuraminate cytidylyltransferase family protein [Thiogranum longum]